MSSKEPCDILVYDCRFTMCDENGDNICNADGEIIIYNAPKLDFSYIAEYADVEDLVPVSTVESEADKTDDD